VVRSNLRSKGLSVEGSSSAPFIASGKPAHRPCVPAPLDAVALNAGIGAGGAFATDTDLSDELKLIDLNVRSTVQVAERVLREIVARGEGRVLFTSSIASTMPGSFQAVYNASKSFVQCFGLALREELKDSVVSITLLMPGPTETEFFERADMFDACRCPIGRCLWPRCVGPIFVLEVRRSRPVGRLV
jgi:short-subunit dehydrogenase